MVRIKGFNFVGSTVLGYKLSLPKDISVKAKNINVKKSIANTNNAKKPDYNVSKKLNKTLYKKIKY